MSTPVPAEIACNPYAFTPEERQRYDVLRERVRVATGQVDELEDGFALRFTTDPAVLSAAGEWIALERRCCPFLDFSLQIEADQPFAMLSITGPDGTKDVLREGMAQPLFAANRLVRR